MPLDEVKVAERLTANEKEHEQFRQFFTNDKRAIDDLTRNINTMSTAITELVTHQQHLLNKKPFWDTWAGRAILVFAMLVVAGLLVAAIGVNIWNIAPSEVTKAIGG